MRSRRSLLEKNPGLLSTELANTITHGVGLALSICALVVLVVLARSRGSGLHVVACSIYGATLVLLYLASTLYHSARDARVKHLFRIMDHAAIYLLIAGTYTPFALVPLSEAGGRWLFAVVWGVALLGMIYKIRFVGRFPVLSVLLYLAMGWFAILILKPVLNHVPFGGVRWLAAGGVFYTFGIIFYAWKRIPHHHAIWHLFVMAGSACHFFAVMGYVLLEPS